jgi:hypothetical protein
LSSVVLVTLQTYVYIWEVHGSNLDWVRSYPNWIISCFSSVAPSDHRDSIWKRATTVSLQILVSSLNRSAGVLTGGKLQWI